MIGYLTKTEDEKKNVRIFVVITNASGVSYTVVDYHFVMYLLFPKISQTQSMSVTQKISENDAALN